MSGFNHLFFRPKLPQGVAAHFGYGHVNQWMDDNNESVALALRAAGCTATLLELFGFWQSGRWKDLDRVFSDAAKAVLALPTPPGT